MSRIAMPQIDGASASQNSVHVKEAKDQVLDAGMTLDLVPPPPMDEGRSYPKEIVERSDSKKLDDYKKVADTTPSQLLGSNLEHARIAKREKIIQQQESTPDGSPAQDGLSKIQNQLDSLKLHVGTKMESAIRILEDLQRRLPLESPLQDQGDPRVNHVQQKTLPGHNTTILTLGSTPKEYPASNEESITGHKRNREAPEQQDMDEAEIERYVKRNRAAMNTIYYSNADMTRRAEMDPDHSGVYNENINKPILW
jgi:hypothetical protein